MTTDEKRSLQQRIDAATRLEQRIATLKNLQGLLTAQTRRSVSVIDSDSGSHLWHDDPTDLLAGIKLQVAAVEKQLAET